MSVCHRNFLLLLVLHWNGIPLSTYVYVQYSNIKFTNFWMNVNTFFINIHYACVALFQCMWTCLFYVLQDRNTFHRFDKFNSKYNPIGEVFLVYCTIHSTYVQQLHSCVYTHVHPGCSYVSVLEIRKPKNMLRHSVWTKSILIRHSRNLFIK